MRYMVFVNMTEDAGDPPPALVEAMGKELDAAFAAGTLVAAGGFAGTKDSTEFRMAGGKVTTSDGPYAEAKEVVGGYAIVEARSREEAVEVGRRMIDLHQQHWTGWEGSIEVRQMFGYQDRQPQGA